MRIRWRQFSAPPGVCALARGTVIRALQLEFNSKNLEETVVRTNARTATKLSLPCLTELLQMTIVYLEEFKSMGLKRELEVARLERRGVNAFDAPHDLCSSAAAASRASRPSPSARCKLRVYNSDDLRFCSACSSWRAHSTLIEACGLRRW